MTSAVEISRKPCHVSCNVDYVGFLNFPNQVFRRCIKNGFEFTIMVVGQSGLGKSTFLNVLLLFLQSFTEWFAATSKFLFCIGQGCAKALLPCGVLSRKSIKDQVVLITGTGMGLGRLMAIEFGKLGARLVLWDIDEKLNEETKRVLDGMGIESFAYTIDLSDTKQIYSIADKVKKEVGCVDILINNAGIVSGRKLFDCPDYLMEKTMSVNANALFYMCKCFLPKMIENNRGHVVVIASMAGHVGVNGLVDYCASKHAAVGFSEALRSELASLKKDVFVTTISPYYINTGMFAGIKDYSPLMFPILEPDYVIKRIMEAVLTNAENLFMPKTCHLFLFIKGLLPSKAVLVIAEYFGLNKTMDEFIGRS